MEIRSPGSVSVESRGQPSRASDVCQVSRRFEGRKMVDKKGRVMEIFWMLVRGRSGRNCPHAGSCISQPLEQGCNKQQKGSHMKT